jgi:hypothetical protein
MPSISELPRTLGELRKSKFSEASLGSRTVKDELRANLICKLQRGESLFPGIVGFDDTVVPQLINAILSRHNFILLGLRGQAKTRLVRMLTTLLDPYLPYVTGSEIHDNPYQPISAYARNLIVEQGDDAPISWLTPGERYVEKLATPDVTIADMIGDIDPIKAARRGQDISNELTVHYGLVPRANRGIFAINELPDLAGKIQVGLFNIMQEGDVQIKGYPVRLPLDLLLVFTANPEVLARVARVLDGFHGGAPSVELPASAFPFFFALVALIPLLLPGGRPPLLGSELVLLGAADPAVRIETFQNEFGSRGTHGVRFVLRQPQRSGLFHQALNRTKLADHFGGADRLTELQRSAKIEPLHDAVQVHALVVAVEDLSNGSTDQLAGDGIATFELSLVLQFDLSRH